MKTNKKNVTSALFVAGRSTIDLSNIAKDIRKVAKKAGFIRINGSLNITGFYEHLSGKLPDSFQFHVAQPDEFPDSSYEGLTMPSGEILIREDVYLGATDNIGRDVFTMTHELFHWAVHRKEFGLARADSPIKIYRDPEWQANTGASFILMPKYIVMECDGDIHQLSERCCVSPLAAEVRYKKFKQHNL